LKNFRDTSGELRGKFDSNSTFMTGHRIIKVRSHKRRIPDWAVNDKEIQKFLVRSFPYLNVDTGQRRRAGRWARFINLYFRLNKTRSQIADEMNMTYQAVDSLCRAVKRAANNFKANGRGK
jgi:hypothetical protein